MGGRGSAPCWEVYIDQSPYGHSGYHHCLQWSPFSRRAWRNGRLISGEKTQKDFQVSKWAGLQKTDLKELLFHFSEQPKCIWVLRGSSPPPLWNMQSVGGQEIHEQPKYTPVEPPPRWRNGTLAARKTLSDRNLSHSSELFWSSGRKWVTVQTEVWRKKGLGAFSTEQRLEVWGKMRLEGAVIVRILMNHNRMDPGSPLSVSFLSTYVSILSCYQTSNSFIWPFDALLSSMLLHFRGVGSLLHYSSLSPYFTTS